MTLARPWWLLVRGHAGDELKGYKTMSREPAGGSGTSWTEGVDARCAYVHRFPIRIVYCIAETHSPCVTDRNIRYPYHRRPPGDHDVHGSLDVAVIPSDWALRPRMDGIWLGGTVRRRERTGEASPVWEGVYKAGELYVVTRHAIECRTSHRVLAATLPPLAKRSVKCSV